MIHGNGNSSTLIFYKQSNGGEELRSSFCDELVGACWCVLVRRGGGMLASMLTHRQGWGLGRWRYQTMFCILMVASATIWFVDFVIINNVTCCCAVKQTNILGKNIFIKNMDFTVFISLNQNLYQKFLARGLEVPPSKAGIGNLCCYTSQFAKVP